MLFFLAFFTVHVVVKVGACTSSVKQQLLQLRHRLHAMAVMSLQAASSSVADQGISTGLLFATTVQAQQHAGA